jgi:hypothetical protein
VTEHFQPLAVFVSKMAHARPTRNRIPVGCYLPQNIAPISVRDLIVWFAFAHLLSEIDQVLFQAMFYVKDRRGIRVRESHVGKFDAWHLMSSHGQFTSNLAASNRQRMAA